VIERLWSSWRAAYVTSDAPSRGGRRHGEGSVFSEILASGLPDAETHIVHRGSTCFAIANLFPYSSGHLLIVPYREVPDLDDLDPEETTDLWATVTTATRVLREVYRPEGMNVGLNLGRPAGGSVPDHLHVHVVPRWTGDANFMAVIGGTQTLPEALDLTTSKVTAAWARTSGQ
jgi:ATP adenylyltransferase